MRWANGCTRIRLDARPEQSLLLAPCRYSCRQSIMKRVVWLTQGTRDPVLVDPTSSKSTEDKPRPHLAVDQPAHLSGDSPSAGVDPVRPGARREGRPNDHT